MRRRAKPNSTNATKPEAGVRPILDLIDEDLRVRPNVIRPFPQSLRERIRSVVSEVEVDLDAPLTGVE